MATRRITRLTAVVAIAIAAGACGSSSGSKSGSSTESMGTTTTSAACAGAEWSDATAAWKTIAPGSYAEGRQQVADDLAALRRGQDTSEVGQVSVAQVRAGEPLVVVLSE